MAVLAAEKVFLGDYADGGLSDIQAATERANMMISKCGMSKYGFVGMGSVSENFSEINSLLKDSFKSAVKLVESNKAKL